MNKFNKFVVSSVVIGSFLGSAAFANDLSEGIKFTSNAVVKQIDASNWKLIDEVVTNTKVSGKGTSKSKSSINKNKRSYYNGGEQDDDDTDALERETVERWFEDDDGDSWYEWKVREREDEEDDWEVVSEGRAKEGSPGYEKPDT